MRAGDARRKPAFCYTVAGTRILRFHYLIYNILYRKILIFFLGSLRNIFFIFFFTFNMIVRSESHDLFRINNAIEGNFRALNRLLELI